MPDGWLSSQTVVAIISGLCVVFTFIVRRLIASALYDFLDKLDARYIRQDFYRSEYRELARRVTRLEERRGE